MKLSGAKVGRYLVVTGHVVDDVGVRRRLGHAVVGDGLQVETHVGREVDGAPSPYCTLCPAGLTLPFPPVT